MICLVVENLRSCFDQITELIFIYQILRACKNVAGSDLLFCRGTTLSEWNLNVPQGDVAQDDGGQVQGWLGGVTSSTKSKICW